MLLGSQTDCNSSRVCVCTATARGHYMLDHGLALQLALPL